MSNPNAHERKRRLRQQKRIRKQRVKVRTELRAEWEQLIVNELIKRAEKTEDE